jgi:hypothetical protein
MSNYEFGKKKQFSITNCLVGRKPWKNNKVKYTTVKQLKTQTMQTKYDIKTKWNTSNRIKKNAIKLEGMNLQINNNQEKYKTQK